jgi:hypothetical protein
MEDGAPRRNKERHAGLPAATERSLELALPSETNQPPCWFARRLVCIQEALTSLTALLDNSLIDSPQPVAWVGSSQAQRLLLNLLGLLLERCDQGLNLIFLQSDPCRLLFSRVLQLLHDLEYMDVFFLFPGRVLVGFCVSLGSEQTKNPYRAKILCLF